MSNETETIIAPVEPVAEPVDAPAPVAAPAEVPEMTYTFQPTDESGRSLGGVQVIKYRQPNELADKLKEQNILLIRKLRETTRKQRLGIGEDEIIPETAPRFDQPVEFTPRVLSDDERYMLSRDLQDPEKFNDAASTLFESQIGVKPETLRNTLASLQTNNLRLVAKAESDAFVQTTPGYYRCQENFEVITNWMLRKDLAPVRENFQLAYDTLRAAGLLLEAPNVREEVPATQPIEAAPVVVPTPQLVAEPTPANSQPVQETPSRITTDEPAQEKRVVSRVPTGLTRDQAGDAGAGPSKMTYTLREINAMPSEVYKRKLLGEPGFVALVEKLEAEAQKRR